MSQDSFDRLSEGAGPEARFRTALGEGRLLLQRCESCGQHIHYPRVLCPKCGSRELREVAASGKGTLYSVSIVRQKPEHGGDYNVVLVDLEEGPRLMSQVVGIPPQAVTIGMSVQAKIAEVSGQLGVLFEKA